MPAERPVSSTRAARLAELVDQVEDGILDGDAARELLAKIVMTGGDDGR